MIQEIYEMINPKKIIYEGLTFETYAILEGTKVPMLWSDLEDGVLKYDILFKEEKLREKLETRGPFLVQLDFESEIGKEESLNLLKRCYSKNALLLFALPMTFPQTLQRVREIFYLKDDNGEDVGIIRFYEPEVFRGLMYEDNQTVQKNLFDHIYAYWCEDTQKENSLMLYRYTPKGVGYQEFSLENPTKKKEVQIDA